MKETVKLSINIEKGTFSKIEKLVMYKNLKDQIHHISNNAYSIEDFIIGCVNIQLEWFKKINELSGMNDLGKPYKLKNRLKEVLKSRKMAQRDLAELTGIDDGNISIILSNRSQPSLDYFLRIWIALDYPPIEDILYREE